MMTKNLEVSFSVHKSLQEYASETGSTPEMAIQSLLNHYYGEDYEDDQSPESTSERQRNRRCSLVELAQAGKVAEGDTLYLSDLEGQILKNVTAQIRGRKLLTTSDGIVTISNAARLALIRMGEEDQGRRGTDHWVNAKGVSLREMWEEHLKSRGEWIS